MPWLQYKIAGFVIIAVILMPLTVAKFLRKYKDSEAAATG
jgi:hypothetical protein